MNTYFEINWDKVKSQDDIIAILKQINIGFRNPNDQVKALCDKVEYKGKSITNIQTGHKILLDSNPVKFII